MTTRKISFSPCSLFISILKLQIPGINIRSVIESVEASINSNAQYSHTTDGKETCSTKGNKKNGRHFEVSNTEKHVYLVKREAPSFTYKFNLWLETLEKSCQKDFNANSFLLTMDVPESCKEWLAKVGLPKPEKVETEKVEETTPVIS